MTSSAHVDVLVSVGIPTFNAAATVSAGLTSLLSQTHERLEILVSDNASTDGTADRIEEIARRDPRVRIIHQPKNLGAQANFRFLLSIASGDFFMWAGSDDVHHREFVSSNLNRLLTNEALSGSISQVRWTHGGRSGAVAVGTKPLFGTPRQNLATYMRSARDNSRFYGLFRRDALVASFPDRDFYGFDISVMAGTLSHGGHDRVECELLQRERTDPSEYIGLANAGETTRLDRAIPLRHLTVSILTQNYRMVSVPTLWWLMWRNIYEHTRYWATTDGHYRWLAHQGQTALEKIRRVAWESEVSGPS